MQEKTMAEQATDVAADAADTVKDAAAQVAHTAENVADDLNSAIRKSLREQPYTTLAIGFGLASVLGALWKR